MLEPFCEIFRFGVYICPQSAKNPCLGNITVRVHALRAILCYADLVKVKIHECPPNTLHIVQKWCMNNTALHGHKIMK